MVGGVGCVGGVGGVGCGGFGVCWLMVWFVVCAFSCVVCRLSCVVWGCLCFCNTNTDPFPSPHTRVSLLLHPPPANLLRFCVN
jgi:hypothetical protein